MQFDQHFIERALSNISILYDTIPHDPTFCIDSRAIKAGDIFVALCGARVDGHDFIQDALKNGAAGLIISHAQKHKLASISDQLLQKKMVIAVDNTSEAFIALAKAWRSQFSFPVIGVTGSVGKTSTKELIATIFAKNGNSFLVSQGNQNTRIGIALNMLRMRSHHEIAIFEVGINRRGEMAELVSILNPTTGVITSIGHCHMEGLGSLHDIALEKRDIFKNFSESSIGVINGDLPNLSLVSYAHPVIKFGFKTTNQIQARKISSDGTYVSFMLKIYKDKYFVSIQHPNVSVVNNILAAAAITHLLNVPTHIILDAIQAPPVIQGRFQKCTLKNGRGVMINDAYNANPESMKASLLAFQQIKTEARKIAVIGDMLELGINSPFWHRQIGRFLRKIPSLQHVILVGDLVKWTKKMIPVGLSHELVPSWKDAVDLLKQQLNEDSVVLVKGSLGTGLKHLVEEFAQQ